MKRNKKKIIGKNKKTKKISLDFSSKLFKDYNEALRTANSLKIFIERMIDEENKNNNTYSAFVAITVSEHDPHSGYMSVIKNGMKGRPKSVFIYTEKNATKVNPHIHIFVYGNPADMIVNRIIEHMNRKFHSKISWKKDCGDYDDIRIGYMSRQASAVRTVKRNSHGVLDDGYIKEVEKKMKGHRTFNFTKMGTVVQKDLTDEIDDFEDDQENKSLECKNISSGKKDIYKKKTFFPFHRKNLFHGKDYSFNKHVRNIVNTVFPCLKKAFHILN